jgi:hypothetical protein
MKLIISKKIIFTNTDCSRKSIIKTFNSIDKLQSYQYFTECCEWLGSGDSEKMPGFKWILRRLFHDFQRQEIQMLFILFHISEQVMNFN